MIPVEKLLATRTIVTHEGCPDGIASALLLHDALPEARIVFAQYGDPSLTDLVAEPGILFCDISPPRERAAEFVAAGAVVLDHHKQARDVVESFGERAVFADEKTAPGVSGAWLAYLHVWLPLRSHANNFASLEVFVASKLARLAGIRDTWLRSSPDWLPACKQAEALRFWPVDRWLALARPFAGGGGYAALEDMLGVGAPLFEKRLADAERAVDRSWRTVTRKGTRLCVFEGLSATSDAAELLDDAADLVMGFGFEAGTPSEKAKMLVGAEWAKCIFSTRSHTGYDCGALAKYHGGGGHTAAAGFSFTFSPGDKQAGMADPYSEAVDFVERFETAHGAGTS